MVKLEIHTKFWSSNILGRDYVGSVDERTVLKWITDKRSVTMSSGLNWVRTVSDVRLL